MYQRSDFKRCQFNPLEPNPIGIYPRLAELLPLEQRIDSNSKMVRYVVALYDPKSPLISDYPDMATRKVAAAEVAGFDLSADSMRLDTLYTCDDEIVVRFIVAYLREIARSREWASVVADEQTYWEFIARMMIPINRTSRDKDDVSAVALKTKLSEDKESIGGRLERNWKKFFSDDDELRKRVEARKGFSPEEIAGVR